MQDLRAFLRAGNTLIADGAAGTMLQAQGLPGGAGPELWNVENPAAVRALHRAYVDAGSQVVLTNTFGGNRIRLEHSGAGDRVAELNRAAAVLAREEVGDLAYVAGDMGPTGQLMAPYGPLSPEEAVEIFVEQARALVEGGVDLLWIETMSDLNEVRAAIAAAHRVTDRPLFCSLSFGRWAKTMMGVGPAQAAKELWPLGIEAIGLNCGEGVEIVQPVLTEMHAAVPEAPLIAKPNAGLPRLVGGQTVFDLRPEDLAAHVPQWLELGARVLGACCGSSPAHIAAISAAVAAARQK